MNSVHLLAQELSMALVLHCRGLKKRCSILNKCFVAGEKTWLKDRNWQRQWQQQRQRLWLQYTMCDSHGCATAASVGYQWGQHMAVGPVPECLSRSRAAGANKFLADCCLFACRYWSLSKLSAIMPKGKIIEIITKMLLTLCAERSELWEGIASSFHSLYFLQHASVHFISTEIRSV